MVVSSRTPTGPRAWSLDVEMPISAPMPNWPPSTWLGEAGLTAPVLADDAQGSAASAYGLSAFPFFTAVSTDGKVVARTSGEIPVTQFDQLIQSAKSG